VGVRSDRPFALKRTSVKNHTRRKGAPRQGCSLLNCTSALYRDCVSSNVGQSNHGWLKGLEERENGRI
jgi:hypothetical protein